MSTRLIQTVPFVNVGASATVALPHNININSIQKKPDYVAMDAAGFDVTVTPTQVIVTNNNAAPASVNVWLELKHSIPREVANGTLAPQPFVAAVGGTGGGPSAPQAVIFDDAVPADKSNIRSARIDQSPIDNTKVGITNISSSDGSQDPTAVGAIDDFATIGGGDDNSATSFATTVAGGAGNKATGDSATVSGGAANIANADGAVIGGGYENIVGATPGATFAATIGGGYQNQALGDRSTIAGGIQNTISAANGDLGTIGGGIINDIDAHDATIAGGHDNNIGPGANYGTIGGGLQNTVTGGESATIAGGVNNQATEEIASVGGGLGNIAGGYAAHIGGGQDNLAPEEGTVIGGGYQNHAEGYASTIVGGQNNIASGSTSIAGGDGCVASGESAVAMGAGCAALAFTALAIGDGCNAGGDAAVALGEGAGAAGNYGSLSCGDGTSAAGESAVALGNGAIAPGDYSFALGDGVTASGPEGAAAFGDGSVASGESSFASGFGTAAGFASVAVGDCVANDYAAFACNYGISNGEAASAINAGTAKGDMSFAHGEGSYALRQTQEAFASGSIGRGTLPFGTSTLGWTQTSLLVMKGVTPGAAPVESVELKFGNGGSDAGNLSFSCEDDRAYTIKVTATIGAMQGATPVSRSIELSFNVRRAAGVSVLVASAPTIAYGDGTTNDWTLVASIGAAPDRVVLTFTTGAIASKSKVAARFEFTETRFNV